MNVRSLIVGVLIAAAPIAIHAQTGIYVNPMAMRISTAKADSGLYAFLGQNSTSAVFWGVNFGAYHDFKTPYSFMAGLDVHDSILHGNGAEINNFDAGLRISGHPSANHVGFKPYIEPFIGSATTRAPFTVIRQTRLEYGVSGGVDYETHHHVDFRLIEVGYTSLTTISTETTGGAPPNTPIPGSQGITFSAGFVFRFP
jgi:hypothetical protein